jgi:hypothetical protein
MALSLPVPAWLSKSLPYVAVAFVAIGKLGPQLQWLDSLLSLSPAAAKDIGDIVADAGIVGAFLTHPVGVWAQFAAWFFPGLLPVPAPTGPLPVPADIPTRPQLVPSVPPKGQP